MMPTQSSIETLASVAAPARRPVVRSPKAGWCRSVTWQITVATSAAKSSAILIWNTGFFSDRGGSPTIMTIPVRSRTMSVHQMNGRKRARTSFQRLVRGVEAEKAEIDHQRGGRDYRDPEDVNRLHDRDNPVMDLDRLAHLGSL